MTKQVDVSHVIKFNILVPLVCEIIIKREDDRWGDESKIYNRYVKKLKTLFKEKARECVIPKFVKGECNCNEDYRIAVNHCRQWILENIDSKFK